MHTNTHTHTHKQTHTEANTHTHTHTIYLAILYITIYANFDYSSCAEGVRYLSYIPPVVVSVDVNKFSCLYRISD